VRSPSGSWRLSAAAVGPGDDLQYVTVRVCEVHAAATVAVVDHLRLGLARICPVRQVVVLDAAEGRVKFFLTDEEGVVLGCYRRGGLGEVQRDAIVSFD
jgi:hypothetical protein